MPGLSVFIDADKEFNDLLLTGFIHGGDTCSFDESIY